MFSVVLGIKCGGGTRQSPLTHSSLNPGPAETFNNLPDARRGSGQQGTKTLSRSLSLSLSLALAPSLARVRRRESELRNATQAKGKPNRRAFGRFARPMRHSIRRAVRNFLGTRHSNRSVAGEQERRRENTGSWLCGGRVENKDSGEV